MQKYGINPSNRDQVVTFLYFPDTPPDVIPPETEEVIQEVLGGTNEDQR